MALLSGQAGRLVIRLAALGFLGGVLLVQQLPALPSLAWAGLLVPLAGLAWRWPRLFLPLLFLLTAVLWSTFRAGLVLAEQLPLALEGQDLRVEGRIAGIPAPTEHGVRFAFDIESARSGDDPVTVPRRVQLSTYDPLPALAVGDRWQFTVRLKRPRGFQNPGGFDYEAYLLQQRLRATGYVRDHEPPQRLATLGEAGGSPAHHLNRFRQQLSLRIGAALPGHAFAPMITAFANGDDDSIPDHHWEVLTRTGTGHLIAISGMNIGLVAGLVFMLARWLWSLTGVGVLWLPAPRVAAVSALLAATGYAALAGFAIPTQRALVMLAAGLLGVLLGRRTAPSVLLAMALLAVLVFDPLAVLAPGFWLSFAAVAVILYVVTGGRSSPGWRARALAFGRVQWAVTLGLLPLLLFIFQQASVASPLANLAAIPVVELVVIPATLLGVLGLFTLPDVLAVWPLLIAGTALEWLWPLLEALARWPAALWAQAAPAPWALVAAGVGVALLLAPRGYPARWVGGIWLLPLALAPPAAPSAGEVWLTLLDVGQGLSAVVRTAGHTLVFDTGARFSARFDLGRAVLVPYLRHAGVGRVDVLVVSHGDNDHIGGSQSLLAALPVTEVLSSVPERIGGSARACAAGQTWEWDAVRFEILHPEPGAAASDNDGSCVLRIESRFGRVLLPGDIEAGTEHALVATRPEAIRAEVLVVPHHGSRSSSSESFVEQVGPQLALVPVGHRNRYRHPHPDVVARYRERGIRLEDSAHAGALEVRVTGAGVQVDRHRERHRRYWLGQ